MENETPAPAAVNMPEPAAAGSQNPWIGHASTFSLNSRKALPVLRPRGIAQVLRSAFRAGELRITERGLELRGQAAAPLPLLTTLRWVGYAVFIFGYRVMNSLTASWSLTPRQRVSISLGTILLGLLFAYGCDMINNNRRKEGLFRIPWDNFIEMQVHPQLRWAVILFLVASSNPGAAPLVVSLPVNGLQPTLVQSLSDAIEVYAPGRSRCKGLLFDPGSSVSTLMSVAYGLMMVFVLAVWIYQLLKP